MDLTGLSRTMLRAVAALFAGAAAYTPTHLRGDVKFMTSSVLSVRSIGTSAMVCGARVYAFIARDGAPSAVLPQRCSLQI